MSFGLGISLASVASRAAAILTPFDYYVDPVNGSALNSGRTPGAAKAAWGDVPVEAGMRIGFVRGETLYSNMLRESLLLTANVHIGAYGAGYRPIVARSVRHTSGWANSSGTVYAKDIGYAAQNVFVLSGGDTVTKLIVNTSTPTTPGAGGFGVSGTSVYIDVGADPAGMLIEIPASGTDDNIQFNTGSDYSVVEGIASWFGPNNGFEATGGSVGVEVSMCDLSYNSNDGFGAHGTASIARIEDCVVRRNGGARTLSGGRGDGISFHDYTTGFIRRCDIRDNEKSGISNQSSASVDTDRCFLRNNAQELFILSITNQVGGTHNFTSNVIYVPGADDLAGYALQVGNVGIATPENRPTVNVFNNTFYGSAIISSRSAIRSLTGNVTSRNNIITGFSRGHDYRSSDTTATLDNDHDCLYNCTTPYFNNGTAGVTAGAHDVAANPLFVSAGTDFRLQSGSPCVTAGVAVEGVTADKDGKPFASPPSIGAYQFAA
ncbi:DUF5123 domain-containing protein [Ancylobacter sp. MQZ15Z-1]|uniref:DUF5123 domain-containing protein n=1 Tax=Ancylobacter mangrovi TaxID=2972472 RepID=A0A9X2P8E6_9HYPH|nr:DUF5123 domain-containing protein [Ancylobacter mangrovi]MCS0494172.1 DUF5123 domain-containing protein [Ancylobacter mangrovi]